jgi:hypothetical protein
MKAARAAWVNPGPRSLDTCIGAMTALVHELQI